MMLLIISAEILLEILPVAFKFKCRESSHIPLPMSVFTEEQLAWKRREEVGELHPFFPRDSSRNTPACTLMQGYNTLEMRKNPEVATKDIFDDSSSSGTVWWQKLDIWRQLLRHQLPLFPIMAWSHGLAVD